MTCPRCTETVLLPAKFCIRCGAHLPERKDASPPVESKILFKVLAIVVVCSALLFVIRLLVPLPNRPSTDANTSASAKNTRSTSSSFSDHQKVTVKVPSACAVTPDDFSVVARSMVSQDRTALMSLVNQGRVLLLDGGTRAEIIATGLRGGRTNILIESGEYIGKTCDLLTAQLCQP